MFFKKNINPILHSAWLESHELTLKNNTAKYCCGEKSSCFAYLPKIFSCFQDNSRQVLKHFAFSALRVLKKVKLNVWQTSHRLF
jgi:hypothetical protein